MILRKTVFLFILFFICVKPKMADEDDDEDSSGDEDEEEEYYFGEYYEDDYEDDEIFSRKIGRNVRGEENTIGTVLFGKFGHLKKCFSQEDIALLSARKEFEVRFFLSLFWFYL